MRPTHCLPEQSEGKTKVIRQQPLPFTVLKLAFFYKWIEIFMTEVATAPIDYGIETLFDLFQLGNKQPYYSYHYYLKLHN